MRGEPADAAGGPTFLTKIAGAITKRDAVPPHCDGEHSAVWRNKFSQADLNNRSDSEGASWRGIAARIQFGPGYSLEKHPYLTNVATRIQDAEILSYFSGVFTRVARIAQLLHCDSAAIHRL